MSERSGTAAITRPWVYRPEFSPQKDRIFECLSGAIDDDFLFLSSRQLEEADLSDIIAGRPEAEALRVLELVCSALRGRRLKSIDLSDNALGEKVGVLTTTSSVDPRIIFGLEQTLISNSSKHHQHNK
jgi:hypothetical protein